jgi:hypothetical protein
MLLLYAVVLGVTAGLATRGRLSALGEINFRFWPVALIGLAFQALLFSSPLAEVVGSVGPSLYVASTTLVLMALVVNLRQPGVALLIVGAMLNFVAIIANNGYMPASADAVAALTGGGLPTGAYTNSAIAAGATQFGFLGDIFVLPRPLPFANIFSIGDVLIGVGGAWFIAAQMHRRAAATPASTPASQPARTRPLAARPSVRADRA